MKPERSIFKLSLDPVESSLSPSYGAFIEVSKGGYVFLFLFFILSCFLRSGAAFLAVCCILELKSLICMPTWLLAFFGFWRLALAVGFIGLLALGFRWFLVFVFTWLLYLIRTSDEAMCSVVICMQRFIHYTAYNIHVNRTETADIQYMNLYACCCERD